MKERKKDIFWHDPSIMAEDRWERNLHKSCLIWFTGLSASGKSTIAHALDKTLHNMGANSYVLDGDNIRHGLNKDLGLSPEDRRENIRRIGEVANLFIDAGLIVITAFISPYRKDRRKARALVAKNKFIEVYVKCPFDECSRRDPKGLYKRAMAGKVKGFTGLDAPYEEPAAPEIVLETDRLNVDVSVKKLLDYLAENNYIKLNVS